MSDEKIMTTEERIAAKDKEIVSLRLKIVRMEAQLAEWDKYTGFLYAHGMLRASRRDSGSGGSGGYNEAIQAIEENKTKRIFDPESQILELREIGNELRQSLVEKEAEVERLNGEIHTLKKLVCDQVRRNDNHLEARKTLEKKVDHLQDQYDDEHASRLGWMQSASRRLEQINSLSNELKQANENNASGSDYERVALETIKGLKVEIERLNEKNKSLLKDLASIRSKSEETQGPIKAMHVTLDALNAPKDQWPCNRISALVKQLRDELEHRKLRKGHGKILATGLYLVKLHRLDSYHTAKFREGYNPMCQEWIGPIETQEEA